MKTLSILTTGLVLASTIASAQVITDVNDCPTIAQVQTVQFTLNAIEWAPNYLSLAGATLEDSKGQSNQWLIGIFTDGKNPEAAQKNANTYIKNVSSPPVLISDPIDSIDGSPIACSYTTHGTFVFTIPVESSNDVPKIQAKH